MNDEIKILIVDDHHLARKGMRQLLADEPRLQIVGEARNGTEAVRLAAELMPDMMLIDIEMPEMNGLEATRLIKMNHPQIKIIMITVSDDVTNLFEAIKRGAQGYLLKNVQPAEWGNYLRAVADDESPLSKQLAVKMMAEFQKAVAKSPEHLDRSPLTEREKEILEWVARGKTNREISEILFISENTVKNHLKHILFKLHMQNRVQLTRYAYEQGMIN